MVLAIAIPAIVNAQMKMNSRQLIVQRVSRTQSVQLKTTDEKKIVQLTKEIKSYDEQIAELQRLKTKLNSKIDEVLAVKTESAPAPVVKSLTQIEMQLSHSAQLYTENMKLMKKLLATPGNRAQVTDAVANQIAEASRLAKSSQYMKEEAYSLPTEEARANMLANAFEKMEQARAKQETVLVLLQEPSGPSILCLKK